jgi:hypothetical protein
VCRANREYDESVVADFIVDPVTSLTHTVDRTKSESLATTRTRKSSPMSGFAEEPFARRAWEASKEL